jgi:phospholipid-binding lipoprotein MlaA
MNQRFLTQRLKLLFIAAYIAILSGCAASGGIYDDPRDPYERFNRSVYSFNEFMDEILLVPLMNLYKAITPGFIDDAISNFFSNINELVVIINDFLQLKFEQMFSDIARLLVNSTLGIAGFFDVSTDMGMEKHREDFGQTLGVWGFDSGPYMIFPLLGPTTVRDAIGSGIGSFAPTSPFTYINNGLHRTGIMALNYVDYRADLLGAEEILSEAALDEYEFLKSVFLEQRHVLVNDIDTTEELPEGLEEAINFE